MVVARSCIVVTHYSVIVGITETLTGWLSDSAIAPHLLLSGPLTSHDNDMWLQSLLIQHPGWSITLMHPSGSTSYHALHVLKMDINVKCFIITTCSLFQMQDCLWSMSYLSVPSFVIWLLLFVWYDSCSQGSVSSCSWTVAWVGESLWHCSDVEMPVTWNSAVIMS